MNLAEFTSKIRDDAARFRIDRERAQSLNRELFPLEQDADDWLREFMLWVLADRRGKARPR